MRWNKFKKLVLVLPSVFTAVAEEFNHVGEEESPNFHQLRTGCGVLQQGSHYLQNHWRKQEKVHNKGAGSDV